MNNSNCGWPFTGNPLKALKFTTDKKSVRSVTVVFTVEIFSGNFWRECFCKSDVQRTLKRNKNVSRVTLSTAKQHKVPVHYQKAHEFLLIPPCLSLTVVKVWTEQVQSTHLEVGRKQSPESSDYKRGNSPKIALKFRGFPLFCFTFFGRKGVSFKDAETFGRKRDSLLFRSKNGSSCRRQWIAKAHVHIY